ncbi:tripeptide aminopeptidase [Photobacterium aphoticum]|uniref:Tripeptide aminopeptidase n=1 Tax=Photobacterium aphoticum TaxID=754436 RepID=A0A090QN06_9GAMM|nr:tripeptide aminopeptidase [Photobacterium aphoticum]
MEQLIARFLRYVRFETQSNPANAHCPSTDGQRVLAQQLKEEMIALGLSDVTLDDNGYLMARLPSNVEYDVPAIALLPTWTLRRMRLVKM